jgi:hypothetical protein
MSSYKNKILNHKPAVDPSLWDNVEDKVISLNKDVSTKSKISLAYFLGALLSLFGIALIYLWMSNDSFYDQNKGIRSSSENHTALPSNDLAYNENSKKDEVNASKANTLQDSSTDNKLGEGILSKNSIDRGFISKEASALVSRSGAKTHNSKNSQNSNPKDSYVLNVVNKEIQMSDIEITNKPVDPYTHIENHLSDSENELLPKMDDKQVIDDKKDVSEVANQSRNNVEIITQLERKAWDEIYSKYDNKDKLSPCNPVLAKKSNAELGCSFGIGTHLYPGYFTNFMVDFRLNKLVRAGIKINHQRYDDGAKFITYPNVLNGRRYTNLLANISLMLIDNQKLSVGIDLSPGLGLVTDNQRKQNGDDFYLLKEQYYGFNYMIGAHLDYKILQRWKLGWESVVDVNGETTIHGLRLKYIL